MTVSLISLPLRLGVRTARVSLRATRDLAELGLATLELVGRALGDEPSRGRDDMDVDVLDVEPLAPPAARPTPSPPTPSAAPALEVVEETPRDLGLTPEPHIPDDRELVEEFADAGAEDGAGATLRVEPPFKGYDELRAPDVIGRLGAMDAAALGETELYERTHRRRRTVLAAIEREARRRPPR